LVLAVGGDLRRTTVIPASSRARPTDGPGVNLSPTAGFDLDRVTCDRSHTPPRTLAGPVPHLMVSTLHFLVANDSASKLSVILSAVSVSAP
jgi:hypothetical protein